MEHYSSLGAAPYSGAPDVMHGSVSASVSPPEFVESDSVAAVNRDRGVKLHAEGRAATVTRCLDSLKPDAKTWRVERPAGTGLGARA